MIELLLNIGRVIIAVVMYIILVEGFNAPPWAALSVGWIVSLQHIPVKPYEP